MIVINYVSASECHKKLSHEKQLKMNDKGEANLERLLAMMEQSLKNDGVIYLTFYIIFYL